VTSPAPTSPAFLLDGKRALITGASGGLGLHFARVLHGAGAAVVLAARRSDLIVREAEALGSRATAVTMDVAKEASIVAAFEAIAKTGPPCAIVVNNAGISGASLALATEAPEWESVINVNLTGAFYVAREAARRLGAAKQPGSIINIASVLAVRGIMAVAPYMASKAGLLHLTRSLALEFARANIRVNAICPGYFETDINRDFMETEFAQKMVRRIPQRRLGELADLSGPLLLLASDAGAFMTGSAITVDGGQSINSL